MREHKSIGYNFTYITIAAIAIYYYSDKFQNFNFILENINYAIVLFIFILILSINEIKVNRAGIIKKFFLLPLIIKQKTWREIKCYVEVDEVYQGGENGDHTDETIWFIDKNDKVCLRINRSFRHNLKEVLEVVNKYEDKAENKLKISNPYFMKRGWTKVKEDIKLNDNSKQ